jgi:hypothetical protein
MTLHTRTPNNQIINIRFELHTCLEVVTKKRKPSIAFLWQRQI